MLSGEVGYFKGTLQLTHPAFLVMHDERQGRRNEVAEGDCRGTGDIRREQAALRVRP